MRILHLIPSLGGGGAERQLGILAAGLRDLGCEVHVGFVSEGANLARLEAAGAHLHRIPARGNLDPLLLPRLVRLILNVRPDVVQTWLTQMDVAGGLAALLTRRPWIVSERTHEIYYPGDAKHGLRRLLGRFANAIVANSQGGAEYWDGARVEKVVVPNALPLGEIAAAPRDGSDFGASEVLLFAGRFDPAKNLENLVDALAPVVRERDALALLCGEGPLESALRARIAKAGVADRIRLLGFTDRVWSLMKRADVLVAASWFEGHPNVVLEAAACGCPLVLSDIPAHRQCFGDDAALFADPADPAALAAAIRQTLEDPAAASARAGRARAVANALSIDSAAGAYLRAYENVTA
jgi:glycosyltransferase involved in cell wall biosynthesis